MTSTHYAVIGILIALASSLASWVGVFITLRMATGNRMEKTIANAIELAVTKLRTEIMREVTEGFVPKPACISTSKHQDEMFEDCDDRMAHLETEIASVRAYAHRWRHKVVNILTAVILFVQNEHRDSKQANVLGDAVRTLQDE